MKAKVSVLFSIILFSTFVGTCFSQSSDILITDIRLLTYNSTNDDPVNNKVKTWFNEPTFISMVRDSIIGHFLDKDDSCKVLISVNSMAFISGLTNKPYNYKSYKPQKEELIVVFESTFGYISISNEESTYEIASTIKIMNHKKKKVYKNAINIPLVDNSSTINKEKFRDAYLKSLCNLIQEAEY